MKQKTNTVLGVRVPSMFSALALATVIAITLGSCSKNGHETQPSQPSSKVASTEATPISGGAYYHNIYVYIPSRRNIRSVSVKVGSAPNRCRSYSGAGGQWFNVNMTAKQGESVTVMLLDGNFCLGIRVAIRSFRAPGNDGLSNWWLQL